MRPARYTEDQSRALILDEADKLISQFGFSKTTIADIAKACGFSSANVHKFFGTKSAIKEAIAARHMDAFLQTGVRAAKKVDSADAKLRAFVTAVHDSTLIHFKRQAQVFEGLSIASEQKWDAVREYRLKILAFIEDIISDGVTSGEFTLSDPKRAAIGVHMAMFRILHPQMIIEAIDEPDSGSVDILVDTVLAGLKR